jgi:hypothetical protein
MGTVANPMAAAKQAKEDAAAAAGQAKEDAAAKAAELEALAATAVPVLKGDAKKASRSGSGRAWARPEDAREAKRRPAVHAASATGGRELRPLRPDE